jgi:hypothetical protein
LIFELLKFIGGVGPLNAFIHQLPQLGTLLQADGVTPIDISLPVPQGLVVYQSTVKQNPSSNDTYQDSFSYVVKDEQAVSSNPALVKVIAFSQATASSATFDCQEGRHTCYTH